LKKTGGRMLHGMGRGDVPEVRSVLGNAAIAGQLQEERFGSSVGNMCTGHEQ
jgi:hypothetical protein